MNTLVTESMSKMVSPFTGRGSLLSMRPVGDDSAPLRFDHPNDDSDISLISVDAVNKDFANFGVRRN